MRILPRNGCPPWNAATVFDDEITFLCSKVNKYMFYPKKSQALLSPYSSSYSAVALCLTSRLNCNGPLYYEHWGLRFVFTCYGLWSICRNRVGSNMFARTGVRLFPWYKRLGHLCPSNGDWFHVQPNVRYVNDSSVVRRI